MPFFSIIVPIYNAEKSLRKCLQSLLVQTEPDFEVFMVDNGSSDGSNDICREYAGKDGRFILTEMPVNCGPSGARNAGLDGAHGTWVAFVDSDDFVEPMFLERIREAAQNADAVFFGYRQYSLSGEFLGEHIPKCTQSDGPALWAELHRQGFFGYTWIKAFRQEVIGDNRFPMDLNLMEDEVFACLVLAGGCRTAVLPEPLYNYITGSPGSLMGRTHPDYCRKVDIAYRAWKTLLTDQEELVHLANSNVHRCMYYGFERDVDLDSFFRDLAKTDFFRDCTLDDRFCSHVRSGKLGKLRAMRRSYRMKQTAARLLKK